MVFGSKIAQNRFLTSNKPNIGIFLAIYVSTKYKYNRLWVKICTLVN